VVLDDVRVSKFKPVCMHMSVSVLAIAFSTANDPYVWPIRENPHFIHFELGENTSQGHRGLYTVSYNVLFGQFPALVFSSLAIWSVIFICNKYSDPTFDPAHQEWSSGCIIEWPKSCRRKLKQRIWVYMQLVMVITFHCETDLDTATRTFSAEIKA